MEQHGPEDWDVEADVVVVGSGAGGLCAALSVNAAGHRALMIEKGSTLVWRVNSSLTVAFLVGMMCHVPDDAFTAGVR